MTSTEIISEILNAQLSTEELQRINKAVHEKFLLQRRQETSIKLFTLRIGDRVKIGNIRPKKYSGVTGEIIEINGKRATVKPDPTFGYLGSRISGIPFSCLNSFGKDENDLGNRREFPA